MNKGSVCVCDFPECLFYVRIVPPLFLNNNKKMHDDSAFFSPIVYMSCAARIPANDQCVRPTIRLSSSLSLCVLLLFFLCVVCYIFGFGSVCCCLSQSIALLWCDTPYNKCAHTHTVSDHHAHTTHTHSLTTHNTNTHLQYCATTHKHRHDTDQLFITQI